MKPKKLNKKQQILSLIGLCMLCLVLITTGMAGKALARYMTSTNNSDTAYVATFEINTNLNAPEATLNLSGIKPGMSQSVTLTVSNTSEVSVYYKFSVSTNHNLPLEFTFAESSTGTLLLGGAQNATHTLTVFWPADKTDVAYASEIDTVTISLECTQID